MSELHRKEAIAGRLKISLRKLDELFKHGKGPRRTFIGKQGYVSEDDYQEWLSACAEHQKPDDLLPIAAATPDRREDIANT